MIKNPSVGEIIAATRKHISILEDQIKLLQMGRNPEFVAQIFIRQGDSGVGSVVSHCSLDLAANAMAKLIAANPKALEMAMMLLISESVESNAMSEEDLLNAEPISKATN